MSEPMPDASNPETPLAIICGAGTLPFALADAAVAPGRRVVLFALRGWADPHRVAAYPHHWTLDRSVWPLQTARGGRRLP